MAAEVRVRAETAAVRAALERLQDSLPATGDMSPAMRSLARVMKTATQQRFRAQKGPDGEAWKDTARGGQVLSLTRRLRNSITAAHDHNSATVGTNVAYAAIHQFGGVIRAKKGPFLAIPVTPEARAAGSPKGMPGLRVWQTIKGQFVMGSEGGTVHFLLRRQVTMPARPFLGVSDTDENELLRVLKVHLEGVWKR